MTASCPPSRLAAAVFPLLISLAGAAEPFDRTEDVIYGRKHGVALTLDVFTPKKANGAAVIFVVSGGWFSAHEAINPKAALRLNRWMRVEALKNSTGAEWGPESAI